MDPRYAPAHISIGPVLLSRGILLSSVVQIVASCYCDSWILTPQFHASDHRLHDRYNG